MLPGRLEAPTLRGGRTAGPRAEAVGISRPIACTVLLLLLLSLSACTGGGTGGLFSNGNDLDASPLDDETAAEVILFVYEQLNWFAMRTPETAGNSKSFADGTVHLP